MEKLIKDLRQFQEEYPVVHVVGEIDVPYSKNTMPIKQGLSTEDHIRKAIDAMNYSLPEGMLTQLPHIIDSEEYNIDSFYGIRYDSTANINITAQQSVQLDAKSVVSVNFPVQTPKQPSEASLIPSTSVSQEITDQDNLRKLLFGTPSPEPQQSFVEQLKRQPLILRPRQKSDVRQEPPRRVLGGVPVYSEAMLSEHRDRSLSNTSSLVKPSLVEPRPQASRQVVKLPEEEYAVHQSLESLTKSRPSPARRQKLPKIDQTSVEVPVVAHITVVEPKRKPEPFQEPKQQKDRRQLLKEMFDDSD